MIDLVCLVADVSIEAAVEAILRRPEALGTRALTREIVVHPERDPGCFLHPETLLGGYTDRAHHALLVLDRDWQGAPADNGPGLEELLAPRLEQIRATWARAVVIDPELEAWAFAESPHVATVLGWSGTTADLRRALEEEGLWTRAKPKPDDPKRAMRWALRHSRQPLSSSLFRELGTKVSFNRCRDRAFLRLVATLREWFADNPEA